MAVALMQYNIELSSIDGKTNASDKNHHYLPKILPISHQFFFN